MIGHIAALKALAVAVIAHTMAMTACAEAATAKIMTTIVHTCPFEPTTTANEKIFFFTLHSRHEWIYASGAS